MGLLEHSSGTRLALAGRTLIGRSARCDLHIPDGTVSGEHATLHWRGEAWSIRDLGSRNGTFVDGSRLAPGTAQPLRAGARLGFGTVEGWCLVDDSPPGVVALAADGRRAHGTGDLLALPSSDEPEVVVYADAQGAWWREKGDERTPLDGPVSAGGTAWSIVCPETLHGTATLAGGCRLDTARLVFTVSRDEEHVALEVLHRGMPIPLEAREHLYVLLTLARLRMAEADQPLAEQGWVERDRLLKMLGMGTNALNVAIHRGRRQLGRAGVEGAADIVEVRRGLRRFGVEPDRIRVVAG